jgi:hypothetical protein
MCTGRRQSSDGRQVDRALAQIRSPRAGGALAPTVLQPPSEASARRRGPDRAAPSSPCVGRHDTACNWPDTSSALAVTRALHALRALRPPWLGAHDTPPSTPGPSGSAHPPDPGAHRGLERRLHGPRQHGRRALRVAAHRGRWRPPLSPRLSSALCHPGGRGHARVHPLVQSVGCAHAHPHRQRCALGHQHPGQALTTLRLGGPPGAPPRVHRARHTPAERPP